MASFTVSSLSPAQPTAVDNTASTSRAAGPSLTHPRQEHRPKRRRNPNPNQTTRKISAPLRNRPLTRSSRNGKVFKKVACLQSANLFTTCGLRPALARRELINMEKAMLKNFVKNSFWIATAFLCVTQMSHAQDSGPTVQNPFPASSALMNIAPDADGHLTLAGEYKQPKNVVEQERPVFWTWYADVGYESEYNFRGTNLTPGANGAGFFDVRVSKWNFTLGLFGIHQFGTASVQSWSVAEGGGGGTLQAPFALSNVGPVPYTRFPTTFQTRFDELDVFLSYKFSLGPIDITLGNIGFFIARRATTNETDLLPPGFIWLIPPTFLRTRVFGRYYGPPDPTVEDEQFDRLYITLSTTKISKYITPSITYYQTIYSWGSQPTQDGILFYNPVTFPFPPFPQVRPTNPRPFNERNEALGGYLEG